MKPHPDKLISTQVPSYIGTVPNSGTISVLSLLPIKRLDLYIDCRCATIDAMCAGQWLGKGTQQGMLSKF
jgi:hypothetical protein